MSAEEWGDFTGQVLFEVGLEAATVGGAAALTAVKVADKGLDVVKVVDRLDDLADGARLAENAGDLKKLETIEDGAKLPPVPEELGEVTFKTKNQSLKGKKHPVTNVPFEEKTIIYDGKKYKGVFPEFDSKFDANLPENMYLDSDYKQFKESTKQLKKKIEENPSMKDNFTESQLEDIMNEEPYIDDLTWHHNEDVGKIELVDRGIHADTGHTGGRNIWGGGSHSR